MFALSKKQKSLPHTAALLYEAALDQARQPVFYRDMGVPDTVDGRFEMITLHVFMIMEGLKAQGYQGTVLFQSLFDTMFRDLERAGREMGIGDLSIPRQVKRMMEGFHGRVVSYGQALEGEKQGVNDFNMLHDPLERNLYGTVGNPDPECIKAMASYVVENVRSLQKQALPQGNVLFKSIEDRGL